MVHGLVESELKEWLCQRADDMNYNIKQLLLKRPSKLFYMLLQMIE